MAHRWRAPASGPKASISSQENIFRRALYPDRFSSEATSALTLRGDAQPVGRPPNVAWQGQSMFGSNTASGSSSSSRAAPPCRSALLGVGPASSSSAAAAPLAPLESATAMPASSAIAAVGNMLPQMALTDNQLILVIKREIQNAQNDNFWASHHVLSVKG